MAKRVDSSNQVEVQIGALILRKELVAATGSRPAYERVTLWCAQAGCVVPLQISAASFVIDGKPVASLRLGGCKLSDVRIPA
jgi:hypothetical protein